MRRENDKTVYELKKNRPKKIKNFLKNFTKSKDTSINRFNIGGKIRYFIFGFIFSLIFIFFPLIAFIVINLLPNPSTLSQNLIPQTTKIYDRNGVLLTEIYADQNRVEVPLYKIPKNLINGTIAIEDKSFYKNPGFDIFAIIRATIADIKRQGFQGGSTITQQLIKSELLSSQISISRKVEEIILAFWAQKIYSKDKILEMYFNQVPYGGSAWGVESAAQTYFNTDVWNLDLAQCAFLAGLPQAPTNYSPINGSTLWQARRKQVLDEMLKQNYITLTQYKKAINEKLVFSYSTNVSKAPHFTDYIKKYLEDKYGPEVVEKGGLKVITTLDLKTQEMAQNIVSTEVAKDSYLNLTNGAALITNPKNGDILAMVGSIDYNQPDWGEVNLTTAFRQPGSSIKIVTYAEALKKRFTQSSLINDSPVCFPDGDKNYCPGNYDNKFHGIVPLYIAFANSFNIPAVKTLNAIGINNFIAMGKTLGISDIDSNYVGLSATLGGIDVTMLDMATAYDTVANSGNRIDLNPILKITDSNGNVLEEKNITSNQVLDPGIAFIISNILSDNLARSWEFGTNSPLVIPNKTVSVKTGTTDDKRDNWTIGYTPNIAVSVWVGNNDNSPMDPSLASGITGAAPIWHDIMSSLLTGKKDEKFPIPSDIYSQNCQGKIEYFLNGTHPSPLECYWKFGGLNPATITPVLNQSQTVPSIILKAADSSHGDLLH